MKLIDAVIVPTVRGNAVGHAAMIAETLHADMLTVRNEKLAAARNKGLLVAETCGWRNILFLDDDIRIHPDQVTEAARVLRDTQVAAFRSWDFPDNSVVRHAERTTGVHVPVYPGAGAMLINMSAVPVGKRFPGVYNEDWLYMHGLEVAEVGDVDQLPYDPFVPGRAAWEEFGDLIAEAIKDNVVTDDPVFWECMIAIRGSFLDSLDVADAVKMSVAEARETLDRITVEQVVSFIHSWQG